MRTKRKKTMIERLREIRDRISLDTMNMTFEELQQYFEERKRKAGFKLNKYKISPTHSFAAEPSVKYSARLNRKRK